MCAIVVIVWCLILISPWENFQEISVDKYRWLKSDCRNYPEVKPLVRKFYKDGKITKYEFNKIESKLIFIESYIRASSTLYS